MWPNSLQINVSRESMEKLEIYHALLLKWQKAVNLVSPKTLDEAWQRHFADSAQLAGCVSRESSVLVDLGSGAGFPGLVLAIIRSELDVHLVESDERKCQFLRTVSRETNVDITVHNARIESVKLGVIPDIVSARALADLKMLLDYCGPWIAVNPQLECLFMKGAKARDEIIQAREFYDFECEVLPSKTDPAASILSLRDMSPKSRV
ncbi:MAG TPA: 16S rRNA (guanine(527)-N(7))-methyltransferase RsmG [Alphaproteobacteria bacterium]|nr:16S rRNA (guanine(527)-N(7))-methyltransferase RsmG [Alphaproteobacteria bacterium]USO05194.1 MAG: 16S rRNA (guanine(527)-N(7))-methyltransferase RsmG [Rhodospirillales bacterium]HOO82625.1 16S rRNA (guanine(527)-N(7))-methyltransferase RsmG [Alphaproteobacteria bacterium]